MKRRGTKPAAVHMQCTVGKCRKRFKGHPGDSCPKCGGNAKPNVYTNTPGWRPPLCDCDGPEWTSARFSRHRRGSPGCVGELPVPESPGTGGEFPF